MSREIPRRSLRLLAVVVAIALTVSTAALAVRGEPQKELTPGDNARARSILLKKSDLGPGFKPTPQSAAEVDFYCKALDEADLTLTGEAESPNFERGIVFVSSSAQVYGSRADASTSWRRGTTAAGERCARDVLRREFAKEGIRLESYRRVAFPNVAQRSVAYRVHLSARSQGVTVRLVMDFIALMHSRAHAAVFFGGLSPVHPSEQLPLVELVAQRMASAMRGA